MEKVNNDNSKNDFIFELLKSKELDAERVFDVINSVIDGNISELIRLYMYMTDFKDKPTFKKEAIIGKDTCTFEKYDFLQNKVTYSYLHRPLTFYFKNEVEAKKWLERNPNKIRITYDDTYTTCFGNPNYPYAVEGCRYYVNNFCSADTWLDSQIDS